MTSSNGSAPCDQSLTSPDRHNSLEGSTWKPASLQLLHISVIIILHHHTPSKETFLSFLLPFQSLVAKPSLINSAGENTLVKDFNCIDEQWMWFHVLSFNPALLHSHAMLWLPETPHISQLWSYKHTVTTVNNIRSHGSRRTTLKCKTMTLNVTIGCQLVIVSCVCQVCCVHTDVACTATVRHLHFTYFSSKQATYASLSLLYLFTIHVRTV